MAENKIREVAKLLGLELYEEFEIEELKEEKYRFTETNVEGKSFNGCRHNKGWNQVAILTSLLNGTLTIKRTPWKPDHLGQEYWFANHHDFACQLYWQPIFKV